MAKVKAKAEKAKPKTAGLMTEVAVETLAFSMGRAADIDEVLKQAGVSRQRLEMPIYVQGPFDIAVVTVKGVALTTAQYDAVRAQALINKIELRKVVGN